MEDKLSQRELLILTGTGLLSPAIRALPGESAALAGVAGWLAPLLALPAAMLLTAVVRRASGGEGLMAGCQSALGRRVGRAVLLLCLGWGVVLLGLNVRLCAQRVLSTGYEDGALPACVAVLLAVTVWVARGKLAAFGRAGEVFYLLLAVVLGVVLVLSLFGVEPENLLPVWTEDLPGGLKAGAGVVATLSYGIYAAFLGDRVERREGEERSPFRWAGGFCLLLTLIQGAILGTFGPGLTAGMKQPFFMMVKGIGVQGVFQRFESVVMALWVLTDLVFLGLLTFSCCALAGEIFPLRQRARAALPVAALALPVALLVFPSSFAAERFAARPAGIGNLILGAGLPILVAAGKKLRERRRK